MAFQAGRLGYFKVGANDWSLYIDDQSMSQVAKLLETTAFGKSFVTRIAGLKDTTGSVSGPWDATLDGYMATAIGASSAIIVGPMGSTGGNVKYSGNAFFSNYQIKEGVDGRVEWSADYSFDDTLTRGTF